MFKRQNQPIIEFAVAGSIHNIPLPAKNSIPLWWKQSNLYIDGDSDLTTSDILQHTVKRCSPFMDSFLTGYVAELWCDVLIKQNVDKSLSIVSRLHPEDPIEMRHISSSINLPVPAGHSVHRLAWRIPYFLRTPQQYSCLITHPLNRFDLPFTTLSGIVDTHTTMYGGNIPFFLKDSFEGVIPKGTPICQIIPFKRESWSSVNNNEIISEGNKNNLMTRTVFHGWYKKNVRQPKNFN